TPYFRAFGETGANGNGLPTLAMGNSYEFEGYETGGFVGIPDDAYWRAGEALQTCGHYFSTRFVAYKGRPIPPIQFTPADFMGRRALLEGRASSESKRACIAGTGWLLVVDPNQAWPTDMDGKRVEGIGVVRATNNPGEFRLESPTTRLVRLED